MDQKDGMMLMAIAREKNITRAAERLFTAQSALSYRLRNIEREFNASLFVRTPTGVTLTAEGECVLRYVKESEKNLREVKDHIQNLKNSMGGSLRLAASSVFAYYELPDILKKFIEIYPNVDIFLKTAISHDVYHMLQRDENSVAILRGDPVWTEDNRLFSEEPICLVSAMPLDLKELPHHPMIVNPRSAVQDMAEAWWRQNFASPPYVAIEVDSMDICRQMILRGLGWGILPAIGLKGYDSLHVRNLSWADGQPLVRRTWVMCRTSSLKMKVVNAFMDYVIGYRTAVSRTEKHPKTKPATPSP
ncbi:MAG: LysR family transcriptional regulator [Acidobacteriaceae bacterium]|nr:LysR family transcriptional regulator [Acidobacteriaceae bacterium]